MTLRRTPGRTMLYASFTDRVALNRSSVGWVRDAESQPIYIAERMPLRFAVHSELRTTLAAVDV